MATATAMDIVMAHTPAASIVFTMVRVTADITITGITTTLIIHGIPPVQEYRYM